METMEPTENDELTDLAIELWEPFLRRNLWRVPMPMLPEEQTAPQLALAARLADFLRVDPSIDRITCLVAALDAVEIGLPSQAFPIRPDTLGAIIDIVLKTASSPFQDRRGLR